MSYLTIKADCTGTTDLGRKYMWA